MKQIRKPLSGGKKGKMATVAALFTATVVITASGVWFCVYSVMNNISFNILNNNVPGFVFGLLVTYFGVRNFLLVNKLSKEILKDSAYFSWSNFRRAKTVKSR